MLSKIKKYLPRFGLLIVIFLFWLFFAWQAEGFNSEFNIFTMLRLASVQTMIAFAQMVALTAGEMNLAVGAIGGMVAMFVGGLLQLLGLSPSVAILLGLLLAAFTGFLNGMLVTKTGINSFIITLATSSIFTGLMLIITKAESFDALPKNFTHFSRIRTFGLPVSPLVWLMLIVTAILFIMYNKTSLGRKILSVGANRKAAQMSGLRSSRIIVITHTISGIIAGLAGIMYVSMLSSAVPVIGADWVMLSFAAPAIGGTAISGGVVAVVGTMLGGLLIGMITNGVLLLNISNFFVNFFLGLVLLLAVGFDRLRRVYQERTSMP